MEVRSQQGDPFLFARRIGLCEDAPACPDPIASEAVRPARRACFSSVNGWVFGLAATTFLAHMRD